MELPLYKMTNRTPTLLWNDSCAIQELKESIQWGATGATTNPVIVGEVLKKEEKVWMKRIEEMIAQNPEKTEIDITWQIIEEMAINGAAILGPIFNREHKKKGRLSIQTNPQFWNNADKILQHAIYFNTLAPNIQVKIPVTEQGVKAIEESTYHGINVNATVCFTVPQAIAVAEAVEHGLLHRENENKPISDMVPVCTIMIGRVDDWLKVILEKKDIVIDPGYLNWAGIAVMKHAYAIYKQRKYRTRLLAAAYRNVYHWTELVGADMVLTMPFIWQKRFNASGIDPVPRIDVPVEPKIINALNSKFEDFQKAYEEKGMTLGEFEKYGATRRTLRSFIDSYLKLVQVIRDKMIPNPDI